MEEISCCGGSKIKSGEFWYDLPQVDLFERLFTITVLHLKLQMDEYLILPCNIGSGFQEAAGCDGLCGDVVFSHGDFVPS